MRPAHAKLDDAGEPVLITPYGDAIQAARLDRDSGYLVLSTATNVKHYLLGGYSLPAIPRNESIPYHPQYPHHIEVHMASGGANSLSYELASDYDRAPASPPPPPPSPRTFAINWAAI